DDLDIGEWEFNRNHLAIKDRDLLKTLATAGHATAPAIIARFKQLPLPAPQRQQLLGARNVMANWSHTDIENFLLEAGINELDAAAKNGSRRDRAIAIVKFIFGNPGVVTAENSLLSAFLVRKTLGKVENIVSPEESPEPSQPLPVSPS